MSNWKFDHNKLVKIREKKNVSQRQAAKDLGFDRAKYYRYEIGAYDPTSIPLRKMAEYYNVPMEDFFKKVK